MTREATAPELVKLASDGQASVVYAFIGSAPILYAKRVNEASPVNDNRTTIIIDSPGIGSNAKPGMTVLVGSAAGLSDRGIGCLMGSTEYGTQLDILLTSDIAIQDNDYVSVLQDFSPWVKQSLPEYDEQLTNRKSSLVVGGDRMLELTGASVATTLSLSGGIGVYGYRVSCSGGTVTNSTTDHPTITFTAAGEYLVTIEDNGTPTSTYRTIYVHNAANPPKNVLLTGNSADGDGWTAALQLYENQSAVRDRAKVVVFAKDYYGGVAGSIGSLPGSENVVTLGWIDGRTIDFDADKGSVTFEIKPASWWLDQEEVATETTMIGDATGANWHHMASLTVDKMLWFLLEWHTTCTLFMDVIFTGDTRTANKIVAPAGTMLSQIKYVAGKIKATPFVNQYGQMIFTIDTPLIPIADRGEIPSVVTLTKDDYASIDIDKTIINPTAKVIITGQLPDGLTVAGQAPGKAAGRFGQIVPIDGLMASSQAQINELAGNIYAADNTPYKFSISNLRGNNRLIEPGNRIALTIDAADNLDGIAYSGYAIVRSVDRSYDPETGGWEINLDAVAETQAVLFGTGEIEPIGEDPIDPIGTYPPIKIPELPPFDGGWPSPPPSPLPLPPDAGACPDDSPATGPYFIGWTPRVINGSENAVERSAFANFPCSIRSASASNPTVLYFDMGNKGLAYQHLHCYGIDGARNRIIDGVVSCLYFGGDAYLTQMQVTFPAAGAISVSGFELYLDEGYDPIETAEIVSPVLNTHYNKIEETTGGSKANMGDPEKTLIGLNGVKFRWSGTSEAAGDLCWNYQGRTGIHAAISLITPTLSKWWYSLTISASDKTGTNGTMIPPGADYGPGVGNRAVYGSIRKIGWYSSGGIYKLPVCSFDITSGSSQTTLPNPDRPYLLPPAAAHGSRSAVGILTIIATEVIPLREAALQTGRLYNVCPPGA